MMKDGNNIPTNTINLYIPDVFANNNKGNIIIKILNQVLC